MKVLIFGATGMIGRGVLLECVRDTGVERVVTMGRTTTGLQDPKVREIVHGDLSDYSGMEISLAGFDACFYCLGVASSGMKEAEYERITYGFTMAAAEMLGRVHPGMTFVFISGSGTDSTEHGRLMWARVKGKTENALLRLPLNVYAFRPGFIQPLDGIESRTRLYRVFYKVLDPVMPLLRSLLPDQILSTREIGQAMLAVTREGYKRRVLETKDMRKVISAKTQS
jgi:uncharacterized protein YbjT (DUF2867 family)